MSDNGLFGHPELDRFASEVREVFTAPADAEVRARHLAAMSAVVALPPARRRLGLRGRGFRGLIAIAGLVAAGGSAMAATGTLPRPVQNAIANAVEGVLDIPGGRNEAAPSAGSPLDEAIVAVDRHGREAPDGGGIDATGCYDPEPFWSTTSGDTGWCDEQIDAAEFRREYAPASDQPAKARPKRTKNKNPDPSESPAVDDVDPGLPVDPEEPTPSPTPTPTPTPEPSPSPGTSEEPTAADASPVAESPAGFGL